MNNRGHRFSRIDKMAIDKSVLQGIQDGKTIAEIKEDLLNNESIDISYSYLANEIAKAKTEISKKQGIIEPQGGFSRGGRKYTDEQKQRIYDLIKSGMSGYSMCAKLKEEGIEISTPTAYYYINKYKKEQAAQKVSKRVFTQDERQAKVRRTFHTPAERLYYARGNIIDLKNKGYTDAEIAEKYHVQESDVTEFFEKRKYVNPEQYREIIYKSTKGATPEELAGEYGLHADTVRKILTTKQRVFSSDIEQEGETEQELDLNVASNFIRFINTLMTYKTIRTDEAEKLDAQRQDIFHELEMKDLSQAEKLEMLDRIAEIGRKRREAKDYNQIFAPVTEFLADEDNMNIIKLFANRVAEAINKFKELDTRVYFVRGATND